MNSEVVNKIHNQKQRKARIKKSLGSDAKNAVKLPRLTITISNKHVSAQLIDDTKSVTLASASSVGKKESSNLTEKATKAGQEIAKSAKAKKIETVVLDRNGRKYHGRVKAFADAARDGGLKF
jgi:large subunit ribosomal protein L18